MNIRLGCRCWSMIRWSPWFPLLWVIVVDPFFITSDYTMQKILSFMPGKQHFTCEKSAFNVSRLQFIWKILQTFANGGNLFVLSILKLQCLNIIFATTSNKFLSNFVAIRRCNPESQEIFKTLKYRPSLLLLAIVLGTWKCAAELPKVYPSFRLFIVLYPSSEERRMSIRKAEKHRMESIAELCMQPHKASVFFILVSIHWDVKVFRDWNHANRAG